MKILFTGMASSHTNADVHVNNLGFFGVLSDVLANKLGHSIDWRVPSVSWTEDTVSQYDLIFIGIVPPTSLAANKVYGALHLMNMLIKDKRMILVLDHAQLWNFKTSFAAVARDPKSLMTKFYSKRAEYLSVIDSEKYQSEFAEISQRMAEGRWTTTIYPSLPWKDKEDIARILGIHDATVLNPINLDSHLIEDDTVTQIGRTVSWVIDNPSTLWSKAVSNIVHMDIDNMKSSKKDTDFDVYEKIRASLGSMISPQDRGVGTWWSYRYAQSLTAGTPIVTDWRESIQMSDSWGFLAYQIEEMTEARRREVSRHQKESYLDSIPTKETSINLLVDLLNIEREAPNA